MKFVIDNKLYDTDKMELVSTVKKWYKSNDWFTLSFFGEGYGRVYTCQLYRSAKGNCLLVHESNTGKVMGEAISVQEAKNLLCSSGGDLDAYMRLFGDIEEA